MGIASGVVLALTHHWDERIQKGLASLVSDRLYPLDLGLVLWDGQWRSGPEFWRSISDKWVELRVSLNFIGCGDDWIDLFDA